MQMVSSVHCRILYYESFKAESCSWCSHFHYLSFLYLCLKVFLKLFPYPPSNPISICTISHTMESIVQIQSRLVLKSYSHLNKVVIREALKKSQTRHARGKFQRVRAKLNKTVYLSLTPIVVLRCRLWWVWNSSMVLLMVLNLTS